LVGVSAERAARLALGLAVLSVVVAALLALWLFNFVGQWALNIGVLAWLATWIISLGFGVVALRRAGAAANPSRVRRIAIVGLVIDGVIAGMVGLFFYVLIRAILDFS
jgi:hypothetical protein